MSARALLDQLHGLGARVESRAWRLLVDAPAGMLDEATRAALREYKGALLALVAHIDAGGLPDRPCAACGAGWFIESVTGWACGRCTPPPEAFAGRSCSIPPDSPGGTCWDCAGYRPDPAGSEGIGTCALEGREAERPGWHHGWSLSAPPLYPHAARLCDWRDGP